MRGFDLTGYYKMYAAGKSIRIVYRIVEEEIIVEVVGIGRRADFDSPAVCGGRAKLAIHHARSKALFRTGVRFGLIMRV